MFLFLRGKVYHFEYYDESENRLRRISTKCRKKNEAIKFLTDFKQKLSSKPKTNFILLGDFKKVYLQHVELTCSKNYYESVRITFELLEREFNNIPLSSIKNSQLEKYFNSTYQRTPYGAKLYFNTLKCAVQKAIHWNYLIENPLNKIKLPKIPKNNPIFINEAELCKIIENETEPTLKDIYLFAFQTGMRLAEITNLQWNAIDLTERIIKVQNTESFTTKGKRERIIPINETLFKVLRDRIPKLLDINNNTYLFNNAGVKFNDDYVSKRFKKALRQVKEINQAIHFHDLRHSFASNLAQKNVSLYLIKELLGHQDIKTTQVYAHLKVENLKEAVKVLEG